MAALNASATLPSRTRVVDAFKDAAVPNSEFLELFASTPKAEADAALLRCRIHYLSAVARGNAVDPSDHGGAAADAFENNLGYWMQQHDSLHERYQELEATYSQQEMGLRQEIAQLSEQLEQSQAHMSTLQQQYMELQQLVDSSHSHTLHDTTAGGGGGGRDVCSDRRA